MWTSSRRELAEDYKQGRGRALPLFVYVYDGEWETMAIYSNVVGNKAWWTICKERCWQVGDNDISSNTLSLTSSVLRV